MSHVDKVPYAIEWLNDATLDGWKLERSTDGTIRAWGPCPKCFGPAFGPPTFELDRFFGIDKERAGVAPPGAVQGMLASCACGRTHGEESRPGCGRSWAVPVEDQ